MERLIEPEQLPDAVSNVLVHVGEAAGYHAGHIPGAVLVTPAQLVSGMPPAVGRLPEVERLNGLFADLGYDPETTFIVYDDEGGGWAGRFIWTLDVIGHDRWLYLNGGLHAWTQDGMPLEQASNQPPPAKVSVKVHEGPIAEVADILSAIEDGRTCIWDCRSHEEYVGDKRAAQRAGHIPGAVNLDWLELMDRTRGLRLRADLTDLLAAHGIDRAAPLITHCQTHHRSGLSYLVARLLGFPEPRGYHGSWSEWGNRDDTPIRTGPNP